MDGLELRDMPLTLNFHRKRVQSMLEGNGLRFENMDSYVGVFDENDCLVGGGGLKGNVLKCIALSPELRGKSVAPALVSRLRQMAYDAGYADVMVFTKPENKLLFSSMAFYLVGEAPEAILMESNPRGIANYGKMLRRCCREGENGAIVMNLNPMTNGHLRLIEWASAQVDNLYVLIVSEEASMFSAEERMEMAKNGIALLSSSFKARIEVLPTGPYAVSHATFPSYFLKEAQHSTDTQVRLDLDIFMRHVVPALGIRKRFVGTEPEDAVTAQYNGLMQILLPERGVEVCRMERVSGLMGVISASKIRVGIMNGCASRAFSDLPATSLPYVFAHVATWALHEELCLTPKPGLVDMHDNGAHKDMDFSLMEKGIKALHPFFARLATLAIEAHPERVQVKELQRVGIEAEEAMMRATGNINTHRGALFAIGLAVVAAARLVVIHDKATILPEALHMEIKELAASYPDANCNTHGRLATGKYGIPGALKNARSGYSSLFDVYLPYYRSLCHAGSAEARLKLLLAIMSSLDDTNVYHRGAVQGAQYVKKAATDALDCFSLDAVEKMNREFIARNLSPGGAADMLSLTLFVDSITLT